MGGAVGQIRTAFFAPSAACPRVRTGQQVGGRKHAAGLSGWVKKKKDWEAWLGSDTPLRCTGRRLLPERAVQLPGDLAQRKTKAADQFGMEQAKGRTKVNASSRTSVTAA